MLWQVQLRWRYLRFHFCPFVFCCGKDSDTASDGVFCTGGLCAGHSLCNADGQNCAAIRAFPESGSLPDVYGAVADGKGEKITQIIANIVMFAPPGMLLPMAFLSVRRFWKTAAAMGAFSFIIEFIQYFIGRQADIDDFMLNAAGGMLGYLIFALCKKLWKEKKIWKSLIEKNGISVDRKRRSS